MNTHEQERRFISAPPCSLPHAEAVRLYQGFDAERRKKSYALQDIERDLRPGWLVPYLLEVETMLWGRWDYWCEIQLEGELPARAIPRLDFIGLDKSRGNHGQRMLQRCLDALGSGGWSLNRSVESLLDFALFGFGHLQELPDEPRSGAWMALYQLFDLWPLLIWPYDYLGDMMAEAGIGKGANFYPTPHELVEMMTQISYGEGGDHRAQTVHDPCVGTGRMLLHASNHSFRLYGQDISLLACKTTIFNGFLYAPWLVKPFEWDEQNQIVQSEQARMWNRVLRMESVLAGCVEHDESEAPVEAAPVPREVTAQIIERVPSLSLFDEDELGAVIAPRSTRRSTGAKRAATTAPEVEQMLLEI